jgi:hypothetical protein
VKIAVTAVTLRYFILEHILVVTKFQLGVNQELTDAFKFKKLAEL